MYKELWTVKKGYIISSRWWCNAVGPYMFEVFVMLVMGNVATNKAIPCKTRCSLCPIHFGKEWARCFKWENQKLSVYNCAKAWFKGSKLFNQKHTFHLRLYLSYTDSESHFKNKVRMGLTLKIVPIYL